MRRADIMYEGITARGTFGRGRGGLGSFRNGAAAALAAGPAGRSVLPDLDISSWCCITLHFVTFWDISRHFCKIGAHWRIRVDLVFRLRAEVVFWLFQVKSSDQSQW